jgi:hypothetical protein
MPKKWTSKEREVGLTCTDGTGQVEFTLPACGIHTGVTFPD